MTTTPDPGRTEQTRLAALHALSALDQPRRSDLDCLARLAAHVCGVPTAAINLVDAERQWSAASFGYDAPELPRDVAMCNVSISSSDVSHTADASTDPRWRDNPWTTGELAAVRFYAAAPLIVDGGAIVGTVCAFSDQEKVLDRIQVERLRDIADVAALLLELRDKTERLGFAALRDALTGLPNRALFAESLGHALARADRDSSLPTVLFLDVDRFKQVNDMHGHTAGDEVLRTLAERLLLTVRGADVVARLGGDEFVVLCDAVPDEPTDVAAVCNRIQRAFDVPMTLIVGGRPLTLDIGVSVGAVVAQPGESAERLIMRADAAMYADKRARHRLRDAALAS